MFYSCYPKNMPKEMFGFYMIFQFSRKALFTILDSCLFFSYLANSLKRFSSRIIGMLKDLIYLVDSKN